LRIQWFSIPWAQDFASGHEAVVTRAASSAASSPVGPRATDSDAVSVQRAVVVAAVKAGCWRVPEVGFILHPAFWGRGLAVEALSAVIERTFASFPIDAIEADVDPRNLASLGLLTRLGFREFRRAERTVKVGDEWCDSVYLSLQGRVP
jgi:GNAT superfamily N-acetyltransferase